MRARAQQPPAAIAAAAAAAATAVAQVGDRGESSKRSRTVKRSLNPHWNQEFEFWPLERMHSTILHVRVLDWDRCVADDPLGHVDVDFGPLLYGKSYELHLPLSDADHGSVVIVLAKRISQAARLSPVPDPNDDSITRMIRNMKRSALQLSGAAEAMGQARARRSEVKHLTARRIAQARQSVRRHASLAALRVRALFGSHGAAHALSYAKLTRDVEGASRISRGEVSALERAESSLKVQPPAAVEPRTRNDQGWEGGGGGAPATPAAASDVSAGDAAKAAEPGTHAKKGGGGPEAGAAGRRRRLATLVRSATVRSISRVASAAAGATLSSRSGEGVDVGPGDGGVASRTAVVPSRGDAKRARRPHSATAKPQQQQSQPQQQQLGVKHVRALRQRARIRGRRRVMQIKTAHTYASLRDLAALVAHDPLLKEAEEQATATAADAAGANAAHPPRPGVLTRQRTSLSLDAAVSEDTAGGAPRAALQLPGAVTAGEERASGEARPGGEGSGVGDPWEVLQSLALHRAEAMEAARMARATRRQQRDHMFGRSLSDLGGVSAGVHHQVGRQLARRRVHREQEALRERPLAPGAAHRRHDPQQQQQHRQHQSAAVMRARVRRQSSVLGTLSDVRRRVRRMYSTARSPDRATVTADSAADVGVPAEAPSAPTPTPQAEPQPPAPPPAQCEAGAGAGAGSGAGAEGEGEGAEEGTSGRDRWTGSGSGERRSHSGKASISGRSARSRGAGGLEAGGGRAQRDPRRGAGTSARLRTLRRSTSKRERELFSLLQQTLPREQRRDWGRERPVQVEATSPTIASGGLGPPDGALGAAGGAPSEKSEDKGGDKNKGGSGGA